MYKNQLQELAQRSCFNLPSYACVREGPDHAPRFKASVNFNGEIFQGPSHCTTLRQAEHAAAEVALTNLSSRAPSRSLAARVLDETGVYKNLLQETTHRAGLKLPVYTTVRSGPGHQPVFTSTVELAGMCVAGEPAKTKKQAEKNAAMAAWSALRQMPDLESFARSRDSNEGCGCGGGEEQEQVVRYLHNLKPKEDGKQGRQREHCQQQQQKQKRKLVGFSDGTSSANSPSRSLRFQQQWRFLEPSSDSSAIHPSQQKQKNCSFLAPALSTGLKVKSPLLFTLNSPVSSTEPFSPKSTMNISSFHPLSRPLSSLVGNSSSLPRSQDIQTLSDGKNAEQLHEKIIQEKPSSTVPANPFQDPNFSIVSARALFRSPPLLNIPVGAAQLSNKSTIPVPRMMNTGGLNSHGIAPAVQIRSVIPVCATPPMRQQHNPPATSEDDLSAATSKLSKLQL